MTKSDDDPMKKNNKPTVAPEIHPPFQSHVAFLLKKIVQRLMVARLLLLVSASQRTPPPYSVQILCQRILEHGQTPFMNVAMMGRGMKREGMGGREGVRMKRAGMGGRGEGMKREGRGGG